MPRKLSYDKALCLNQVQALFWQKGYAATSMRDIAKATGVQLASLYHSYGDKKALYLAAMEDYIATRLPVFLAGLQQEKKPLKSLDQFLEQVAADACAPDQTGCFLINAAMELESAEPELAARARAGLKAMEEGIAQLLKGQHKNPQEMAHYVMGVMIALKMMSRMGRGPQEITDYANTSRIILQQKEL